jgi:hypothetical protein
MALPKKMEAPTVYGLRDASGNLSDLFERASPLWWRKGSVRPHIAAFDAGQRTGFAFLSAAGTLRRAVVDSEHGRCSPYYTREIDRLLDEAFAIANDGKSPEVGMIVAIETTNLGSAARTPIAALAVHGWACRIEALAVRRGLPVWVMEANRWQAAVLPPHPKGNGRRTREGDFGTKAVGKRTAEALFGVPFPVEDTSDAALVAYYVRTGGVS